MKKTRRVTFTCRNCGTSFGSYALRKYCSRKCLYEAWGRGEKTRTPMTARERILKAQKRLREKEANTNHTTK
jgi:hypothetical protein